MCVTLLNFAVKLLDAKAPFFLSLLFVSLLIVFLFILMQLWFPLYLVLHRESTTDIAEYSQSTLQRHVKCFLCSCLIY